MRSSIRVAAGLYNFRLNANECSGTIALLGLTSMKRNTLKISGSRCCSTYEGFELSGASSAPPGHPFPLQVFNPVQILRKRFPRESGLPEKGRPPVFTVYFKPAEVRSLRQKSGTAGQERKQSITNLRTVTYRNHTGFWNCPFRKAPGVLPVNFLKAR